VYTRRIGRPLSRRHNRRRRIFSSASRRRRKIFWLSQLSRWKNISLANGRRTCSTEHAHCLSTVTAYFFSACVQGCNTAEVDRMWNIECIELECLIGGSRAPGGGTSPCSWKLFVHSHTKKRPKVDRSPASSPNLKHTARHSHDQPILLASGGGAPSPPIPGSTSAIKFFLFKMSLHICMCVVW